MAAGNIIFLVPSFTYFSLFLYYVGSRPFWSVLIHLPWRSSSPSCDLMQCSCDKMTNRGSQFRAQLMTLDVPQSVSPRRLRRVNGSQARMEQPKVYIYDDAGWHDYRGKYLRALAEKVQDNIITWTSSSHLRPPLTTHPQPRPTQIAPRRPRPRSLALLPHPRFWHQSPCQRSPPTRSPGSLR